MLPIKSATFTAVAAAALASGLSLWAAPRAGAQNAAATPSVSTAPPAEPRPDGGDRREEFRQRMEERLKGQLKASDDEWTVIQPLVEKVYEKQRAAGAFGGPGGPGGPGGGNRYQRREGGAEGGNNPAPQQAADNNNGQGGNRYQRREGGGGGQRGGTPEAQALRATLENDNSTVSDIKTKLQAVRDQRKQAATELAQSRDDLRKVLNMRQEAVLVMYGLLD